MSNKHQFRRYTLFLIFATLCAQAIAQTARLEQTSFAESLKMAMAGDPKAMLATGVAFQQGKGVAQDYTRAMDWYLKIFTSSQDEIETEKAEAVSNIAVMYRDGLGVRTNLTIAHDLFFLLRSLLPDSANGIRADVIANLERTSVMLGTNGVLNALNITGDYVQAYVIKRGQLSAEEERLKFDPIREVIRDVAGDPVQSAPPQLFEFQIKPLGSITAQQRRCFVKYVTPNSCSTFSLGSCRDIGGGIFQADTRYDPECRAVFVETTNNDVHVFVLHREVTSTNWCAWQAATYVSKEPASQDFLRALTTQASPATNMFLVRYRVALDMEATGAFVPTGDPKTLVPPRK